MNSTTYLPIGTKHRPPMFSHFIEQTIRQRAAGGAAQPSRDAEAFRYPEII